MTSKLTVIVPVYGDWPSLSECIESLKTYSSKEKHKVLLVNDCGPDADEIEKNIKKSIKGMAHFFYHRNKVNLGFLKNCNNAVTKLDKSNNDILLLNSDAKLTEGALDELQKQLNINKKIAAISPRSNNATICTVPLSAMKQKGIDPEESYKLFKKLKQKIPPVSTVPTAHGFCMLIRRDLIKKIGLFDEVFGKGYGEEVDFCQRARAIGYICALANHAYVFHQEAKSFSLETKSRVLEKNNKIIRRRYPNYQVEVKNYVAKAINEESPVNRLLTLFRVLKYKR